MEIYEAGSGPAVVLLHGAPSPVSFFAPLIEALAPTRRVLCPVLPGYAGSASHPGGYGVGEIARLFADELASRGVKEAAVLGYSYGAYRAIAMALAGALRVTRLYLLSGFAGFDEPQCSERQQMAAAIRARAMDLHPVFVQMVLPPAYAAANPAVAAEIASWIDLVSPDVLAAEVDASTIDDLRPRLHELDVPVLARVGELDAGATPPLSRAIVERVRGGELEIAPGCGHALLIEDAAQTTASVVRFFTRG
jgi:pimeloyl-ACP methyl ester carboxylesterase